MKHTVAAHRAHIAGLPDDGGVSREAPWYSRAIRGTARVAVETRGGEESGSKSLAVRRLRCPGLARASTHRDANRATVVRARAQQAATEARRRRGR